MRNVWETPVWAGSLTDDERKQRYRQGLDNAKTRLANSQGRPDWIAYNERRIAKYKKLLSEPVKPLGPSIPWK